MKTEKRGSTCVWKPYRSGTIQVEVNGGVGTFVLGED